MIKSEECKNVLEWDALVIKYLTNKWVKVYIGLRAMA